MIKKERLLELIKAQKELIAGLPPHTDFSNAFERLDVLEAALRAVEYEAAQSKDIEESYTEYRSKPVGHGSVRDIYTAGFIAGVGKIASVKYELMSVATRLEKTLAVVKVAREDFNLVATFKRYCEDFGCATQGEHPSDEAEIAIKAITKLDEVLK